MELSPNETNIAKGIAICLMLMHHLFAFKERLLAGNNYIPTLLYWDFEYFAGLFGKICVAMFIFLSGYGLTASVLKKGSAPPAYVIPKAVSFYKVYWIYFFLFVPLGIFAFPEVTFFSSPGRRYIFDSAVFFQNLLGFSHTFNGEWWFVEVYVILLLLFFPFFSFLAQKNGKYLLAVSILLFLLSAQFDFASRILFWQACLASGILFARRRIFSSPFFVRIDSLNVYWLACLGLLCIAFRFKLGMWFDPVLAPLFLYSACRLSGALRFGGILEYLGRYSFPMWLNHSFFCYYFFQDIVFYPKYAPLVFVVLLLCSLVTSVVIEKIRTKSAFVFPRRAFL